MTSLFLVRHGETELNKKKAYQGWIDSELTKEGILQCRVLRSKLCEERFDAVITSPVKRVLTSAQIITGLDTRDLVLFEEFKELNFGQWEGMNYKDIERIYPEEWKLWSKDWVNYAIPGGESFSIFSERVKAGLVQMMQNYKDKTILLVSHEGTLKAITLLLLHLDFEHYWNFSFDFGRYSRLQIIDDFAVVRNINS